MLLTILIIIAVIIGVAVYFNLGWYFTKSHKSAVKILKAASRAKLNLFQKFQVGPGWLDLEEGEVAGWFSLFSYAFWLGCLAINLIAWIIYFVFCGGLVKLISPKTSSDS